MIRKTIVPSWAKKFNIEVENDVKKEQEQKTEFENLLENVEQTSLKVGKIYEGKIVNFTKDFVFIDLGIKQEGIIPIEEFKTLEGVVQVEIGQKITVLVEKFDKFLGQLVCSKEKAILFKLWDKIIQAHESHEVLKGCVLGQLNGGLSVDFEGAKAFLPLSQIDIRPIKDLNSFVGKFIEFNILNYNKSRGNIVLSRKSVIENERNVLKNETLKHLQEGMVLEGIVKNLLDYGVFVDLGGVDGLLHITDISWNKIKHPKDVLAENDKIHVKILKLDLEKEKISLGMKQLQANPWVEGIKSLKIHQIVTGKITSIKEYGLFVEILPNVEGLVHISELDWKQKKKILSKEYTKNQEIEVMILEISLEEQRISLGRKQLLPNPWDALMTKYTEGSTIKGVIKSILDFGMFIDVQEFVDGFIHVSDVSWRKKNIQLQKEFSVGQEIEAMVMSISKEKEKFSLGLKQKDEDPWMSLAERFAQGTIFEGKITNITDFGIFIELEEGVEGLAHISELSEDRIEKISDHFKTGDVVSAIVLGLDRATRKVSLSLKKATENFSQKLAQDSSKSESMFAGQLKNFSLNKK